MAEITIKGVEGNPLNINVVMNEILHHLSDGVMETETVDFYPDTTKPVRAYLDCTTARKQFCPTTYVDGNIVYLSCDNATAGVYTLTVTCTDTNGKARRYKSDACIEVYDLTSAAEIAGSFDEQTYEMNGVFYTSMVQSDWDEVNPASPAYILNKPDLTEYATKEDIETIEGEIPVIPEWAQQPQKPSYTAGEVGAVPTSRTVNGKALSEDITLNAQDVGAQTPIADLAQIREGAAKGATAYQKPSNGMPKTDLAVGVQQSLDKANTAYQKPSSGIPKTDLAQEIQQRLDIPIDDEPIAGSSNLVESGAVANRMVMLSGMYSIPTNPQVGQYYYSAGKQLRLIKEVSEGVIRSYDVITMYETAIYMYGNNIYKYNGTELIPSNGQTLVLSSYGKQPSSPEVGQIYYTASRKLYFVKATDGVTVTLYQQIPFEKGRLYYCDDEVYYDTGTSVVPLREKLEYKLLRITGFGITRTDAGVTTAGEFWVDTTDGGQVLKRFNGVDLGSTVIPFYNGAIYTIGDKLLVYDQNELKLTAWNNQVLASFLAIPANPQVGQIYYAPSKNIYYILRINGDDLTLRTIPHIKGTIYVFQGELYIDDGTDLVLADKAIIHLEAIYSIPLNPAVGQYYVSASNQLRLVTAVSDHGTIAGYEILQFHTTVLYECKGHLFTWDGTKLSETFYNRRIDISAVTSTENTLQLSSQQNYPILCGVKYINNNYGSGYGNVKHPIPVGWLYYIVENGTTKFYYSSNKADELKYIFDWNTTVSGGRDSSYYSPVVCNNGDIIFIVRAEMNIGRKNPIIYKASDNYANPVEIDFGESLKPVAGFSNSGLYYSTKDNYFIVAEYTRPNAEPANVWKVTAPFDNPSNWNVVIATTGTGEGVREVEHFHSVQMDMYTGRLYVCSGDTESESKIWESQDDGDTWSIVLENNWYLCRALNIVFTEDCAVWGSDEASQVMIAHRNLQGIPDFANAKTKFIPTQLGGSNFTTGRTYYTVLIDEPFGVLLLQRNDTSGGTTDSTGIFFYDFKNDSLSLIRKLPVAGSGYGGFRCLAVNCYQSLVEKRIMCGFATNYTDIVGNKNNGLGNIYNMALSVF